MRDAALRRPRFGWRTGQTDNVSSAFQGSSAPLGLRFWDGVQAALLILLAGLTLFFWQEARERADLRQRFAFDQAAQESLRMLKERLFRYEEALLAGVAAMEISDERLGASDWADFADLLDLPGRYPGVNGIGVIYHLPRSNADVFLQEQRQERPEFRIHPETTLPDLYPITFIEPVSANREAIGLDMGFETSRLAGLLAASATRETRITAPIVLVQDSGRSPGFLMFAPFYRSEGKPTFAGAVYAPFIMSKLMLGLHSQYQTDLVWRIRDADVLLFQSDGWESSPASSLARQASLPVFGRTWLVEFHPSADLAARRSENEARLVLMLGGSTSILLFLLFATLARSNRKASRAAAVATVALSRERDRLSAVNRSLEQVSFAAAHDLRTPLRSCRDVIDEIEEVAGRGDLAIGPRQSVEEGAGTLRTLVDGIEAVVTTLLTCAQMPGKLDEAGDLDPHAALARLAAERGGGGLKCFLEGSFPAIRMSHSLFDDIFGPLLENARRHASRNGVAQVVCRMEVECGGAVIELQDDGTGPDDQALLRLRRHLDAVHDTADQLGLGLTVAKRAVDLLGGCIEIDRIRGGGTCVRVFLPGVLHRDTRNIKGEG